MVGKYAMDANIEKLYFRNKQIHLATKVLNNDI